MLFPETRHLLKKSAGKRPINTQKGKYTEKERSINTQKYPSKTPQTESLSGAENKRRPVWHRNCDRYDVLCWIPLIFKSNSGS